ncbi:MAG: histidinol-phosphate transaminase [Anaerolineales bacterium]|nr:histidinol-phosphate transaminase [Anaerolineales bacterium]
MNIRPHLQALPPYTPIEPFEILSARIGREIDEIVKLDANENPYGVLPQVREALSQMDFPHIYPDPESRALRSALEKFTNVSAEHLLAGAGADELLDLIMRVFLDPNDCILSCPPTFGMYAFDAELNAARVIEIPRHADFSLNLDEIRKAVETYKPKLFFVTSPNNPDGSVIPAETLDELLDLPTLIVLDEAYIEFADETLGASVSRIQEVSKRENLIVLRTFSKWAGLAGLRVGYGAFPKWLMPTLWKAKQPYNINVAASLAAQVSLEHSAQLQKIIRSLQQERARLFKALKNIAFLKPYPTCANFILCQVIGKDALELKNQLANEYGVFIRHFNKPGLRDHIRISVGKPADTDKLIRAINGL